MKKIIVFLMCCFLVGCFKGKSDINPVIIFKDDKEEIEVIEYLEKEDLKAIIKALNERLLVVEIQKHHEFLSQALLGEFNINESLEDQEQMINSMILDYLEAWKYKELEMLLEEEDLIIDEEDKEEIIRRSSIKSAYTLMTAYEKIYLKKQYK